MSEAHIKVRANRTTGELEVEGPAAAVAEWWAKLWPKLNERPVAAADGASQQQAPISAGDGELPDGFGEFYTEFRSDVTEMDKVLIAGAFIQGRQADRTFTTKAANQLLLGQNTKVANASENVRRLIRAKRVFVVANGVFRVSAPGLDRLETLKIGR